MDPTVEIPQHRRRFAEAIVASPTDQITTKLTHHPLQGRASIAFGQLANTSLELLPSLLRDATLATRRERESQKLAFPGAIHGTFVLVDR